MTTKKLFKWQTHCIEFLLGFDFFISYSLGKKKRNADPFTHWLNDYPANDQNNQQQHLLKTTLLSKRLEISSIDLNKSQTTSEKVI